MIKDILKKLNENWNVNKDFIILFFATLSEIGLILVPDIFLKSILFAIISILLSLFWKIL